VTQTDADTIVGIPFDQILALEGFPDGSETPVYLSGSLVTGIGNAWSDVDAFAITDRRPIGQYNRSTATNEVSQHYLAGRRVDYEFWSPRRVEELAERLGRIRLGTGEHVNQSSFLQIEELFIDRLRTGVPLIHADSFAGYQRMFDFEHFRAFETEEAIRHVDGLMEDLSGMMESRDMEVALFMARNVVEVAVDAYLHWRGNTDVTRKWRAKYLDRLDDRLERHAQVKRDFWRLQFPEGRELRADPAACERYVEEVSRFANRIVSWIQR
jgi:hypothetical protein